MSRIKRYTKLMKKLPPLSLYIHTPWCIRKCPYCDFNSHALRDELPENSYLNALLTELKTQLPLITERKIHSIFIGGGTPSLLSANFYERLLENLRIQLLIPDHIEITLEANPGTAEQKRFKSYREIGINRLSLGIQSLQDKQLKNLGRIHSSKEAMYAIEATKNAGFNNFNLDLMFGLPEQGIDDALFDLKMALKFEPTHLSWYQLTLEPNTYFHRFPPTLPHDDLIWKMQQEGQQLLSNDGFEQYEVSAYSQPNFRCQHNLNYWLFGDYIGIGAGAHSKITDNKTGIIKRHWNVKNPKDYLDSTIPFTANEKIVSTKELPLEFLMNALRLQQPISTNLFSQRTGLNISIMEKELTSASKKGFLTIEQDCLNLTNQGKRYLNNLLELFL